MLLTRKIKFVNCCRNLKLIQILTFYYFVNSRHERESATAMERLQNCLNAEFIADASIPDETVLKGGQKVSHRRETQYVFSYLLLNFAVLLH